jgi:hypothetical protein
MRRDWPLVASGFGIAGLSAACVLAAVSAYERAEPAHCPRPKPPAVRIDGCYSRPGGFGVWIGSTGVQVTLGIAFVLLVVALAVMWRGWSSPGVASGPPPPNSRVDRGLPAP